MGIKRLLAYREKSLGSAHPCTLTVVDNLAINLRSQGRLEEAEPLFARVLGGREEDLGHTHETTRLSRANLVQSLLSLGKHSLANQVKLKGVYSEGCGACCEEARNS